MVAVDGRYAAVRTEPRSVCGGCQARGACGTSLLERVFGARSTQVWALNEARASVGERVVVGISEQGLMVASVAVYLMPILALVVGAVLGQTLISGASADLGSLLGGALGFALALAWLRGYSARAARRTELQAVVMRRAEAGRSVSIWDGQRAAQE